MATKTGLTKEKAIALYANATPDFKKILISEFKKETFVTKAKVKEFKLPTTFAECCKRLGITEKAFNDEWNAISKFRQDNFGKPIAPKTIAFEKLQIEARALNMDANGKEWVATKDIYRYYPYFTVSPSFGFGDTYFVDDYVCSYCGFCLCSKDSATAKHFGKCFATDWKVFLTETK